MNKKFVKSIKTLLRMICIFDFGNFKNCVYFLLALNLRTVNFGTFSNFLLKRVYTMHVTFI